MGEALYAQFQLETLLGGNVEYDEVEDPFRPVVRAGTDACPGRSEDRFTEVIGVLSVGLVTVVPVGDHMASVCSCGGEPRPKQTQTHRVATGTAVGVKQRKLLINPRMDN